MTDLCFFLVIAKWLLQLQPFVVQQQRPLVQSSDYNSKGIICQETDPHLILNPYSNPKDSVAKKTSAAHHPGGSLGCFSSSVVSITTFL